MFTHDVAISPDGNEIYFCVAIGNYTYSTILYTKEENGLWLLPEIVPFSGGPGVNQDNARGWPSVPTRSRRLTGTIKN
jgi:hypothetical protein